MSTGNPRELVVTAGAALRERDRVLVVEEWLQAPPNPVSRHQFGGLVIGQLAVFDALDAAALATRCGGSAPASAFVAANSQERI